MLFRLFAQCGSLGNLVLDLRTKREARLLGLPVLATIHDAFVRYLHAWFVVLTQAVLCSSVLLASLLWTALQQQVAQQATAQGTPPPKRARTLTAQWS